MNFFYKITIIVLLVVPFISAAQTLPSSQTRDLPPSQTRDNTVKLCNPLGDISSFPELIEAVLNGAFVIGLPITVLFVIIAGFRFVLARGNPEQLKVAKKNLLYTIVGIAVFFGAWLITNVIIGTLESVGVQVPRDSASSSDNC